MRCVIVDDERLARAELRRLLRAHPHIEIVGEAADVFEAHQLLAGLEPAPDLLLLDVQMPGGSGFDLLETLEQVPRVIFTTAYDHYALRAFEVNALDYLQKPIQATRLAQALGRLTASPGVAAAPQRLFIRDGERCWLAERDKIRLFESEGNYSRVYFEDQRPLWLRSLNQLELSLPPEQFFRVSRKHLVQLTHVVQLRQDGSGGLLALLSDGQLVEVSRRRAQELRRRYEMTNGET